MKTVITIEGKKVTVEVDDQGERIVYGGVPAPNLSDKHNKEEDNRLLVAAKEKAVVNDVIDKELPPVVDPNCAYCKRRGQPCKRHGGKPANPYNTKGPRIGTFGNQAPEKIMPPPSVPIPVAAKTDKVSDTFMDPWDCGMCRNAQDLCLMHENMEAKGQNPPRF